MNWRDIWVSESDDSHWEILNDNKNNTVELHYIPNDDYSDEDVKIKIPHTHFEDLVKLIDKLNKKYKKIVNRADVIEHFNIKIQEESEGYEKPEEYCPSYWQKQLFIESEKLSFEDWRKIRNDEYWETRDKLKGVKRTRFILSSIKKYLEHENNN
ncbi:MAG: hypothetical protein WD512_20925 [Candidatus Paceibacterota bacterium]